MSHCLIVEGAAACFPRPEITVDQVTYDVITPVAARGLFEAIHWTPSIAWTIERIDILHPIRTGWMSRGGGRALELIDVCYALHARFELTPMAGPRDNPAQHANMFRTRAKRQQFYRTPYLGRRDLIAGVRLAGSEEADARGAIPGQVDLGWMMFDRAFDRDHRMLFFRPVMVDGVIDLRAVDRERLVA